MILKGVFNMAELNKEGINKILEEDKKIKHEERRLGEEKERIQKAIDANLKGLEEGTTEYIVVNRQQEKNRETIKQIEEQKKTLENRKLDVLKEKAKFFNALNKEIKDKNKELEELETRRKVVTDKIEENGNLDRIGIGFGIDVEDEKNDEKALKEAIANIDAKSIKIVNEIKELRTLKSEFTRTFGIEEKKVEKKVEKKDEKGKTAKEIINAIDSNPVNNEKQEEKNKNERPEIVISNGMLEEPTLNNYKYTLSELLENKKELYKRVGIKEIIKAKTDTKGINNTIKAKLKYMIGRRNIDPAIVKAIDIMGDKEMLGKYIESLVEKKELPFDLKIDLTSGIGGKQFEEYNRLAKFARKLPGVNPENIKGIKEGNRFISKAKTLFTKAQNMLGFGEKRKELETGNGVSFQKNNDVSFKENAENFKDKNRVRVEFKQLPQDVKKVSVKVKQKEQGR